MTDAEDQNTPPENWTSVYHTERGPVLPGRHWISDLIAAGDYELAHRLIRVQATQHATRVLRAAGCPFERLDGIARTDLEAATDDIERTNTDRLHDVVEFMLRNPEHSPQAAQADVTLHALYEQHSKMRDPSNLDRAALRQLVMMSMALGYQAALHGTLGSEEALPILEEARANTIKGLRAGRDKVRKKTDLWRGPLEDYVTKRIRHERPKSRQRGMVAKYITGFRKCHPDSPLPGSNIPNTVAARLIDQAILDIHRAPED